MTYIVFEAGSRAGFSAEMFFKDYAKRTSSADKLVMIDDDKMVNRVASGEQVMRRGMDYYNALCKDIELTTIFPADELTRQRNSTVRNHACMNKCSYIEPWYYDKKRMNEYLSEKAKGCKILIPKTFEHERVCIRPNSLSAGSKGIQFLDNVSVTQKIKIVEEYVVDVLRNDKEIRVYPRQVVLKNGYDRLIKFISEDSDLGCAVKEFVSMVSPSNDGVFSDIFHLQLAKADDGHIYYIEWSKRISGTSIVNMFRGMNPFNFINGVETVCENPFCIGEWYRYEDFIKKL